MSLDPRQRKRLVTFMTGTFLKMLDEAFVHPTTHKTLDVDNGTVCALASMILKLYGVSHRVIASATVVANRKWYTFATNLGKPLMDWSQEDVVACVNGGAYSLTLGRKEDPQPHYMIQVLDQPPDLQILDINIRKAARPKYKLTTPAYWSSAKELPSYVYAIDEKPDVEFAAPLWAALSARDREAMATAFLMGAVHQIGYPPNMPEQPAHDPQPDATEQHQDRPTVAS